MKLTLGFVVFSLLISNILLFIKYKDALDEVIIYKQSSKNILFEHKILNMQMPLNLSNNDFQIKEELIIDTSRYTKKPQSENILVCRMSETFCQSCNKYIIDLFSKTSKFFDENKCLFLVTCKKKAFYNQFIRQYKLLNYNVIFVDEHLLPADDYCSPYFFVMNNDHVVKSCYIPSKETEEMDTRNLIMLYNLCNN